MRSVSALSILTALLAYSCGSETTSSSKSHNLTKRDTAKINPHITIDSVPEKTARKEYDSDTAFREFAFIANSRYIILSSSPDTNWAQGKPHSPGSDGGAWWAITDVYAGKLPTVFSDVAGKEFLAYSKSGIRHKVTISGFKLYSVFIPHFGQVQKWDASMGEESDRPWTTEEKARDIWNSAALYLVAEFNYVVPGFEEDDLVFALPARVSGPEIFAEMKLPDLLTEGEREYRTTPQYRTVQEQYKSAMEYYKDSPENIKESWLDEEDTYRKLFSVGLKDETGIAAFSLVSGNPCGGPFYEQSFSIWELKPRQKPVMLHETGEEFNVLMIMDLENDGSPELLVHDFYGSTVLLKRAGDKWEKYAAWEIPYQDCGC